MSKDGQRLFNVGKVGLFLDGFSPGTEKRRGEEVKTVTLSLRVQPFDAKFATAIDDGLGGDSGVRAALFQLNHPDPKPHLERVNLSLGCPRQNLEIFASPDTDASRLLFAQCKIHGTYARTQKDISGYAFCFKATFGPVGRDELDHIQYWYLGQQFVTFIEAEPGMFDEDEDDDEEMPVGPVVDGRGPVQGALRPGGPVPEWNDDEEPFNPPAAAASEDEATPVPKKRRAKKTKKHNPEAERKAQEAVGAVESEEGVEA